MASRDSWQVTCAGHVRAEKEKKTRFLVFTFPRKANKRDTQVLRLGIAQCLCYTSDAQRGIRTHINYLAERVQHITGDLNKNILARIAVMLLSPKESIIIDNRIGINSPSNSIDGSLNIDENLQDKCLDDIHTHNNNEGRREGGVGGGEEEREEEDADAGLKEKVDTLQNYFRKPSIRISKEDNNNNNNGSNSGDNENSHKEPISFKFELNKLDQDIESVLNKCNTFNWDDIQNGKEIYELLKSTILRLNLKNNLTQNELLKYKNDQEFEIVMLQKQIDQLINTLRITKQENEAVNNRNLKYIKYIKTLKNEKLKPYIIENRKLKEQLAKYEDELGLNKNGVRINYQQPLTQHQSQHYGSIPSPLSIPNNYSNNASSDSDLLITPINQMPIMAASSMKITDSQSPTDCHMLDTLGRLATEYLNNEF